MDTNGHEAEVEARRRLHDRSGMADLSRGGGLVEGPRVGQNKGIYTIYTFYRFYVKDTTSEIRGARRSDGCLAKQAACAGRCSVPFLGVWQRQSKQIKVKQSKTNQNYFEATGWAGKKCRLRHQKTPKDTKTHHKPQFLGMEVRVRPGEPQQRCKAGHLEKERQRLDLQSGTSTWHGLVIETHGRDARATTRAYFSTSVFQSPMAGDLM
jgi:hypothetical protein